MSIPAMQPNLRINKMAQQFGEVPALLAVLSDTVTLYLKTWNYHWNIVGPGFYQLHKILNDQYDELAGAVDEIAEQARSLGTLVPVDFPDSTKIDRGANNINWQEMIKQLIEDNQKVLDSVDYAITFAEQVDDQGTLTLLADRVNAHKKAMWMLKALVS